MAVSPIQTRTLVLIRCQALAVNEFLLQVLQGRIIQLELPLEGAIGQAAPLRRRVIT